ncbi:MAG: hypothetical protein RLY78_979 [Pseudomonadota bacterium]|jgi:thiol-disulfide isomerase/thioredoxin|uniref:TlpA disulfide reductase family protein n=1 Tax=Pseudaquabacterium rugosum TaxID=2984194 RepID=A0ABU9BA62_9BURK
MSVFLSRPQRRALLAAAFAAAATVLPLTAQAYKPGDAVDPALLQRLRIDPAKVTVLDFFAEWCTSCRKELPLISAVADKADKSRVDVVGVDTDDSAAVADAFQKEMRAKGALTFRTLNDVDQSIVRQFKPKGYPALYILKDGKVARMHLGAMPDVDVRLQRDLKDLGIQ